MEKLYKNFSKCHLNSSVRGFCKEFYQNLTNNKRDKLDGLSTLGWQPISIVPSNNKGSGIGLTQIGCGV